MPPDPVRDAIRAKVLALAEDCQGESNGFHVLAPFPDPRADRPLYLLVHPGDTVQTRSDVAGSADPAGIMAYSAERHAAMAADVEALIAVGWDVAVLRRFSSSYGFGTSNTHGGFEDAVDAIHADGAVLFGDDLPAAAAWLLTEGGCASRPAVLLSGSWSEVGHGCVPGVVMPLEVAGVRVHLFRSACVSPDGTGEEWKPVAGSLTDAAAADLGNPAPVPRP